MSRVVKRMSIIIKWLTLRQHSIHMCKFQARHSFQPNFCSLTTAILSTRKAQDSNPSKELPDSIQAREKSSQLWISLLPQFSTREQNKNKHWIKKKTSSYLRNLYQITLTVEILKLAMMRFPGRIDIYPKVTQLLTAFFCLARHEHYQNYWISSDSF